jgi:hypothetical protein
VAVGLLGISRVGEVAFQTCPLPQLACGIRVVIATARLPGAAVSFSMAAHSTFRRRLPQRGILARCLRPGLSGDRDFGSRLAFLAMVSLEADFARSELTYHFRRSDVGSQPALGRTASVAAHAGQ